jgi:hypothetical protein
VSVASAWVSQDESTNSLQPFDVTAVCYGVKGDGHCLPVWVLGPSGMPVLNFKKTQFIQFLCQAAELPIEHLEKTYTPPADMPPPDICLKVPPQHFLAKRNHFLVVVLMLPIKHRKFSNHADFIKNFDTLVAKHWEPIMDIIKDVLHTPLTKPEDVSILTFFFLFREKMKIFRFIISSYICFLPDALSYIYFLPFDFAQFPI